MKCHLVSALVFSLYMCISPNTATAACKDSKAQLEANFGITLADSTDKERWSHLECDTILNLVVSLPQKIQQVIVKRTIANIIIRKTFYQNDEDYKEPHGGPEILFWQLAIPLKKNYSLFQFKRIFLHHFLHVVDASLKLSKKDSWRSLSGWRYPTYIGVPIPLYFKGTQNVDQKAFADASGLMGPEEDFVTFGTVYFLPDLENREHIELKCNAPQKFSFFQNEFSDFRSNLDKVNCKSMGEGFLDDIEFLDPITNKPMSIGPIDDEHVEGFELLYATPGVGDISEVAGHLLLRIKLKNNKAAADLNIENPNDLVISFLADTEELNPKTHKTPRLRCNEQDGLRFLFAPPRDSKDDFNPIASTVQALKGLSGGLITTFDRNILYYTVRSYTNHQNRDLLRYRLLLNEQQKRSLLEHLFLAKKSYKTRYFFFDRNCASILVQIIGEGIKDKEIASFDPTVSPPNSLVALFIRKGLAEAAFPSFYSYRKRGYIAQEIITQTLSDMKQETPDQDWPSFMEIISQHEKDRITAYKKLELVAATSREFDSKIYPLVALAQEAELSYLDRSDRCDDITSNGTKEVRQVMQTILKNDPEAAIKYAVDLNRFVEERHAGSEQSDISRGSNHTQLSGFSVSSGIIQRHHLSAESQTGIFSLSAALYNQDMGAITNLAMQRGTAVRLSRINADISSKTIERWSFTGLSLRKLRERVTHVPSYFSDQGSIGLGLGLLDLEGDKVLDYVGGTVAKGELLFSLFSSHLQERYLFTGIGLGVDSYVGKDDSQFLAKNMNINTPVFIEALWTFDAKRNWQLRSSFTYTPQIWQYGLSYKTKADCSLQYRLAEIQSSDILAKISAEYQNTPKTLATNKEESPKRYQRTIGVIGFEWDRW